METKKLKVGSLNVATKRELTAAQKIEDTHADDLKPKKKKEYGQVGYRKKASKKETYLKAIRFNEEQFANLDRYLELNDLGFSELIKDLLEEKGIIKK